MTLPLVQVFSPVVYTLAVETDAIGSPDCPPWVSGLLESGDMRLDAPAPLGSDRDRFLRLISDIRQDTAGYREQLGALFLAGTRAGNVPGPESRNAILSTLGGSAGSDREQDRLTALWQARLLLKLAELFDREQEELRASLRTISARERELLDELKQDGETGLLSDPQEHGAAEDGDRLGLRLMAWSRLHRLGDTVPPEEVVFITDQIEAVDLLRESAEYLGGGVPAAPVVLELPVLPVEDHRTAAQLKKLLHQLLTLPPGDTAAHGVAASWLETVAGIAPGSSRCTLELYRLADSSREHLFRHAFDRQGPPAERGDVACTTVGLLRHPR